MRIVALSCGAGVLLAALLVTGCGTRAPADTAFMSSQRARYVLADEPDGAMGVAEAKQQIQSGTDVVLIGRVGTSDHAAWHDGKAAFLLSDAAASVDAEGDDHGHHQHGEGHDHDGCTFCQQAKALNESLAIVQFLDDDGEVLAIDARQLLGVKSGQLVVVRGHATTDSLGNLVVSATGIYLRD